MTGLLLLPAALAFLVLGAHFLRAGWPEVTLVCLAALGLFWVRRPWAARLLQALLALGCLEWLRTLVVRVAERREAGEPFQRFAVILLGVALFSGFGAVLLQTRPLRRWYRRDPPE